MNNKAFTLVELLAAITILALLALITVPAVTKPIKDSKQNLYDTQLRNFKDAAKSFGAERMFSSLPSYDEQNKCLLIPLNNLIDEGLVEPNVKNPLTGDVFTSEVNNNTIKGIVVKIDNQGTTSNKYVYSVYDCEKDNCYNPDNKDETSYGSNCLIYEE